MNKNLFSYCSPQYARYRPHYPRELFDYLASLAPSRQCAWDVACETGQATVELMNYFDQIFATDISSKAGPQLLNLLSKF